MHFVAILAAVGSVASLASARVGFQFPDTVPLAMRAVTGPAYECHANCGYTIEDAEKDGYCDTTKWKDEFAACMECANTYNIWRSYGTGVTKAAEKCNLTANPKPSAPASSAPASSAPAATSAPSSSAPAASSPSAQPSAPGQSSQPTTAVQTSSAVQSTAVATTGRPTASAAPTSGNTTATTTQVQVGAANLQQPAMLAAGAVALFAVNMI